MVARLRRRRPTVAAVLGAVVVLALLSRRYPLPGWLAEHTGDALYTVAAHFGLALLCPAARSSSLAAAAFLISAFVECSQLLTWQWLVQLRTGPAALLLGQGFQWADFVAYLAGALLAFGIDRLAGRRRPPLAQEN